MQDYYGNQVLASTDDLLSTRGWRERWLISRQTRLIAIKVMRVPGNPLNGIVGGGAVSAITYRILNAVRNKTLNSRVFKIVRESAPPFQSRKTVGS